MNLAHSMRRIAFLLRTRAEGHTSLMQSGLDNYRGDAVVIGLNAVQARSLGHFREQIRDMYKTHYLGYEQMDKSYGLRGATCIDHAATAVMLEAGASAMERVAEVEASLELANSLKAMAYEALNNKARIIEDLKAALREACASPPIKDGVLIEALVKGVAEEGSVGGKY